MNRRHFLRLLGLSPSLGSCSSMLSKYFYDDPGFGNVTLLHFTDCHAQLLPVYYREPSINVSISADSIFPSHLTGTNFLNYFGVKANSREAHAYTYLDFVKAAGKYGKMGGFAQLASLIKQIRTERGPENTLLLDGGDSWQGSATSLWTQGKDMIAASNLLGVDYMTGHWEFTYGSDKIMDNIKKFQGEFIAQNVTLSDEALFESSAETDLPFKPYVIKELSKARIAIIGQAFPYTPIAHPRRFVPDWQFGIDEKKLQAIVDRIKNEKQADVIVLLSHNGLDVDLKLASRISGLDVILGGHTHNALPQPIPVNNSKNKTWVTNAGSNGKFLAVLDMDISKGRLRDMRYRLLPVFADLIEPDPEMQSLIDQIRLPYLAKLSEPVATAEKLYYRRDTFCGTFDTVILDALRSVNNSEIALSPGFRWGTSFLPGQTITREDIMNHTAITYPETYVNNMTGLEIKALLEDIADNLFNKDPYYRQGGDMVRTGGLHFQCNPEAEYGKRIDTLKLANGKSILASKHYNVTGWASVRQESTGWPVDKVLVEYLSA